ncbi:MAG: hypothetical protein M3539_10575 [Acidobacteriota bacterium]|nr:hypothetical protein [Acidobacteriota bacterium]
MLKRFSSLILALAIGSSVLAGTLRPTNEHVCKMAGIEIMPGREMVDHGMEMMDHGMEMMPGMEMPPASPSLSHSHEMLPGMEMTAGMETMPCCMKHGAQSVSSQSGSQGQCCVNIPQETGSSGTTFNLRLPSFSVAVIHPAIVQPPITAPKPYECSYSTEVFLPNLQASYLRNLSFLI